jgi:hypothetical protein
VALRRAYEGSGDVSDEFSWSARLGLTVIQALTIPTTIIITATGSDACSGRFGMVD